MRGFIKGGPLEGSVDQSIQWSVDQVRRGVHGLGGQCFRVTPLIIFLLHNNDSHS